MDKIYKCTCGSEAIHIEQDDWFNHGGTDGLHPEIWFSIWYYGSGNRWTIKELLQHCWQVLKNRKPYPDQICLYPADAYALGEDLVAMARECQDGIEMT
jgi:hypothetical protein